MVNMKIYVEGGGDRKDLKTKCRKGFSDFFRTAELKGRMPRIVASGGRQSAYDDFCTAIRSSGINDFIVLLVDSEERVTKGIGPWAHLKQRDGWDQPPGADDDSAHLMVQCMEAWFFADVDALQTYYGRHFRANAIPNRRDVENIPKNDLFDALEAATRSNDNKKGVYGKGRHSFEILEALDPARVRAASPYADRLIRVLLDKAGG